MSANLMATMAAPTTMTVPMAAATPYTTRGAAPTYTTMASAPAQYTTMAAAPTYTTGFAGTTTMAAPTVYETMAAPVTTYASPATYGTTTSAAPVTYAAPAAQYAQYAQPAYPQYSQPAVTTVAPSFVAAPTLIPQMSQAVIAPPTTLTEGMPTPQQIAQQKAGYAAALDKQLVEAIATIQKETEIEKQMVKFASEKQIALYTMQAEEQLVVQLGLLDEQSQIQQLELKKALVERNLQLSAQASNLSMDYQMKALQTELATKQYQFQQQYVKAENALEKDYMAQVAKANTGTAYASPAATVR